MKKTTRNVGVARFIDVDIDLTTTKEARKEVEALMACYKLMLASNRALVRAVQRAEKAEAVAGRRSIMKKIMVRAWHKKLQMMLYPPLPQDSTVSARVGEPDGDHARIPNGAKMQSFPAMMTWDGRCYINGMYQDLVWLEATGLNDKNGRMIYEGDIVQEGDCVMVIEWVATLASFCLTKEEWMHPHFFGEASEPSDCEVIGNIYENPSLLVGESQQDDAARRQDMSKLNDRIERKSRR